ncbi:hypothetical protein, partial [Actinomadura sp. NPDC000929]|uniref:hypothetical protein n=1 Tax=Actinomadura sp. NPDC000929 TaxID=3154517 RepID=UPI003393C546
GAGVAGGEGAQMVGEFGVRGLVDPEVGAQHATVSDVRDGSVERYERGPAGIRAPPMTEESTLPA